MTAPIVVAFVMTVALWVAALVLWLVSRRRRKRAEPVKVLKHALPAWRRTVHPGEKGWGS